MIAEIQYKIKFCHRKNKSLELEHQRCLKWPQVYHEAILLQSNLYRIKKGMTEISVEDWEQEGATVVLSLDTQITPQDNVAGRFKESKKLKNGLPRVEEKLLKLETEILLQKDRLEKAQQLTNMKELLAFAPPKPPKVAREVIKALPYQEFTSESGIKIWVGKSAKANDKLTFSCAKGSDLWLHAHQFAGSHVVIRNKEPDDETLMDAMHLALFYSKAKGQSEGEVVVTQCKFVARIGKNSPGKVQLSQHKVKFIKMQPRRLERLSHS